MAKFAAPSNIEVNRRLDDVGTIQAEPAHIYHMVINLCLSAFQAQLESGGWLDAALKRTQVTNDAEAGHTLAGRGECMHLSISTGPNSSASFVTNLDPFGTTANPGNGGPGFSLWIVRQLARPYGGDIVIKNDPERPLTLDLYLPMDS